MLDGDHVAAAYEALWLDIAARMPKQYWRSLQYGMGALVSGLPAAPLNGVVVFRGDVRIADVRTLLKSVSENAVPYSLQARPSLRDELAVVALELGMVPDQDIPLMVLDDPAALRSASQIDGLQVRLLPKADYSVHQELVMAGFGVPLEMAQAITDFTEKGPGLREFVGEVGGTPVATAVTLTSTRASLGVFSVATPPEHRRKGYGAAITASVVLDGLENGADFAWLLSSPDGYPIYQRLGFRTVESWPVWITPSDS